MISVITLCKLDEAAITVFDIPTAVYLFCIFVDKCAPSEDSDQPGHPPGLISLRCSHDETFGP